MYSSIISSMEIGNAISGFRIGRDLQIRNFSHSPRCGMKRIRNFTKCSISMTANPVECDFHGFKTSRLIYNLANSTAVHTNSRINILIIVKKALDSAKCSASFLTGRAHKDYVAFCFNVCMI